MDAADISSFKTCDMKRLFIYIFFFFKSLRVSEIKYLPMKLLHVD